MVRRWFWKSVLFVISVLASVASTTACSSSSPPKTDDDGTAGSDNAVGSWACYPELGTYFVKYTLKSGDPERCAQADGETNITAWSGSELPTFPNCLLHPDKATCTLTTTCNRHTGELQITDTDELTYARGGAPPAHGTRHIVTKKSGWVIADGGPVTVDAGDAGTFSGYLRLDGGYQTVTDDCVYEYTYTKK